MTSDALWIPSSDSGRMRPGVNIEARRGSGAWLEAEDGERYLDANSGLWHLSLGYAPAAPVAAAAAAHRELGGTSLLRRSHHWAEALVDRLVTLLGDVVCFPSTSGSEAIDAALRIAFAHSGGERPLVAHLSGGYHGANLTALGLGAGARYLNGSHPVIQVYALPGPQAWESDHGAREETERLLSTHGPRTAAVVVEPIQAVGGMVEVADAHLARLRQLATEHGALLVVDEVSTGVTRTGPFVAGPVGLTPDMTVIAKGLTAGIGSLAMVCVDREVADRVRGRPPHNRIPGATAAGDPGACAAAVATLDALTAPEATATQQASARSLDDALAAVAGSPAIGGVRGRGHLRGLVVVPDLVGPDFVDRVATAGLAEHLLLHPLSNGVVPVVPPLNSEADVIDELRQRLEAVVARLARG